MKIEIDFGRPDELRKTKRELEMALVTIDSALMEISKNGHSSDHPTFPQISDLQETNDAAVTTIISGLNNKFNMREALSAASAAGIPGSRLRREIARLTEIGTLVLAEKGQGRRPASFRKAQSNAA